VEGPVEGLVVLVAWVVGSAQPGEDLASRRVVARVKMKGRLENSRDEGWGGEGVGRRGMLEDWSQLGEGIALSVVDTNLNEGGVGRRVREVGWVRERTMRRG